MRTTLKKLIWFARLHDELRTACEREHTPSISLALKNIEKETPPDGANTLMTMIEDVLAPQWRCLTHGNLQSPYCTGCGEMARYVTRAVDETQN